VAQEELQLLVNQGQLVQVALSAVEAFFSSCLQAACLSDLQQVQPLARQARLAQQAQVQ
jgi:hypothetical protein